MSTNIVRTRFAPSPTGYLHMGGARTALFSFLWARKNNGQFLLRIEDTDQERYQPDAVAHIMEGLQWLGIEWDEGPDRDGSVGPYVQSERKKMYQHYAGKLLSAGYAYRCFCTKERLIAMREEQQRRHESPRYNRACRKFFPEDVVSARERDGMPFVVRFAMPEEGSIVVHDEVRGDLSFDYATLDDYVLLKSDGMPTYHLANVVDDHLMNITHVIRAEEWLPSLPRHIVLYNAFEWEAPRFVHLSLFLSPDGGKMSKRAGATSVLEYRRQGYLPEAVINFIALLGWNPKTVEEFFSLSELITRFSLTQINAANPLFDTTKLKWMQKHYLHACAWSRGEAILQNIKTDVADDIAAHIDIFIAWMHAMSQERQAQWWQRLTERSVTLMDVVEGIVAVMDMTAYPAEILVWKKLTKEKTLAVLQKLQKFFWQMDNENIDGVTLEKKLLSWIADSEWGNGDVLWPLRIALSGKEKSPPPFELAEMLGKEEVLRRIQHAVTLLS